MLVKGKRNNKEIRERVKLLPYNEDVIKNGKLCDIRPNKKNSSLSDFSLVGRAMVNKKETIVKIILTETKKGGDLRYVSVFNRGVI